MFGARCSCARLAQLTNIRHSGLVVVCALFFISTLPLASDYAIHYPDERHYTDGALTMLATGDWVTPRTAEGVPRFLKPVLTYWSVLSGFGLWDITPLGARLPFLLCGVATVCIIYVAAGDLYRSRTTAYLAAICMAGHPLVVLSATRSIPDMPLCFFMTVALWGFLRIYSDPQPRPGCPDRLALWLAYVGTAGAIATKGIPGLVLAGYFGLMYVGVRRTDRGSVRDLLSLPALLVAIPCGGWWFVAMYAIHGDIAWRSFFADQIDQRFVRSLLEPVIQWGEATATLVVTSIPWIVPTLRATDWRQMIVGGATVQSAAQTDGLHGSALAPCPTDRWQRCGQFLVGWILTFLVVAAFVTEFSHRYLLPVVPAVVLLMAHGLSASLTGPLPRWLVWQQRLALGTITLLATVTGCITWQMGHGGALLMAILLGCASLMVLIWSMRQDSWYGRLAGLSMGMPVICALTFLNLRVFALPDQGLQIAERLMALPDYRQTRFVIWSKPALASKIRLLSRGQIELRHIHLYQPLQLNPGEQLIAPEPMFNGLEGFTGPPTYQPTPISTGYQSLKPVPFCRSLAQGRFRDYLSENREHYCLASDHSEPIRVASRERRVEAPTVDGALPNRPVR